MTTLFKSDNISEDLKDTVRSILEDEGARIVQEIKDHLTSEGKVASGGTIASIDFIVIESNESFSLELLADDSLTYIDQGRRAGRQPPISVIEEWMSYKGIPDEPGTAFCIARSIGRFGIQGLFFLDDIVNEAESIISSRVENELGNLLE